MILNPRSVLRESSDQESQGSKAPARSILEFARARYDLCGNPPGSCGTRASPRDSQALAGRCCSTTQRSRIPEFVKTERTIRKHCDGIDTYGFYGPEAALATVMLACGPATLKLPYHTLVNHM